MPSRIQLVLAILASTAIATPLEARSGLVKRMFWCDGGKSLYVSPFKSRSKAKAFPQWTPIRSAPPVSAWYPWKKPHVKSSATRAA